MTFFTYMMRNHKGQYSVEGDLADDMYRDKEKFPRNSASRFKHWHDLILNYLHLHGACGDCISVFEQCWKEYEAQECSRLGMKVRI